MHYSLCLIFKTVCKLISNDSYPLGHREAALCFWHPTTHIMPSLKQKHTLKRSVADGVFYMQWFGIKIECRLLLCIKQQIKSLKWQFACLPFCLMQLFKRWIWYFYEFPVSQTIIQMQGTTISLLDLLFVFERHTCQTLSPRNTFYTKKKRRGHCCLKLYIFIVKYPISYKWTRRNFLTMKGES